MKLGDKIEYDLRASHGGEIGYGAVIGEPLYSENGSHVVLATAQAHGMPIHASHCKIVPGGNPEFATAWRERYERLYPGKLKPLANASSE